MIDEILYMIQNDFPMKKKPFKTIAKKFGITQKEIISIIKEKKKQKIIRQISAIFDTKSLGYKSSLVAFKIDKSNIEKAILLINSHPGVSHNYQRNHSFNIWFTIAISSNSNFELEDTVKLLAKLTNAKDYILLPTLKMFKIAVKLDTTGKKDKKEVLKNHKKIDIKLTPLHYELIKDLQYDIPIISEPFKKIISKHNISYTKLFQIIDDLKKSGIMRRFSAILYHRNVGFNANAMVVWELKDIDPIKAGKLASKFRAVSHCYLRPKYKNWPYTLFTMIHGKTNEETQLVIDEINKQVDAKSYIPLYSSREFKKVRLEYFSNKEQKWEKTYQFES